MVKVSLIAASVREPLYQKFFDSLDDEQINCETIFSGHVFPKLTWHNLNYVPTPRIKPAQCYEIARRYAVGETIVWCADDCEFKGGILTKAYNYWKSQNNEKLVLSLQTREYYLDKGDGFCDMNNHRFIGGKQSTTLMAPLAMISRKYLDQIGGFDRRFLCGQYENLTVCQVYADGGKVEIFGDKESYIEIDHINKSIACGESAGRRDFANRPFARGYSHDRKILEESVFISGDQIRIKKFEPYIEKNLLSESQSHKGEW